MVGVIEEVANVTRRQPQTIIKASTMTVQPIANRGDRVSPSSDAGRVRDDSHSLHNTRHFMAN
jgi:hypothetical protein